MNLQTYRDENNYLLLGHSAPSIEKQEWEEITILQWGQSNSSWSFQPVSLVIVRIYFLLHLGQDTCSSYVSDISPLSSAIFPIHSAKSLFLESFWLKLINDNSSIFLPAWKIETGPSSDTVITYSLGFSYEKQTAEVCLVPEYFFTFFNVLGLYCKKIFEKRTFRNWSIIIAPSLKFK